MGNEFSTMIYEQKYITPNKFIRTFKSDVDTSELVWHRDKKNRIVEVLNDSDWLVQLENELPRKLNKGDILFIPKESYHRVIKGNTDLEIQIIEEKGIRVPIGVLSTMSRGKKYAKKNRMLVPQLEDMLDTGETDYETVVEFKKYFDSKSKNITLQETFKGKPHQDTEYVEWLLRGGEMGQKWVNKVVREQTLIEMKKINPVL